MSLNVFVAVIFVFFLLKMMRVGQNENIFILFLMAIKTAGSAQKSESVGLVETQLFFTSYVIQNNFKRYQKSNENKL